MSALSPQLELNSYPLHLVCRESTEGVYGSGSQLEDVTGDLKDTGGQGPKVLWKKGSWGLANHLWRCMAQSIGNPLLLGLLLVERFSSCSYLGDTNLLLFVCFYKIKNLGIYVCSLQQVLIHYSDDERVPLIVSE